MKSQYVIVNRGKFIRSITILTILLFVIILFATMIGNVSGEGIEIYTEYKVQHGDSLWVIASKVDSNEDVRQIIHTIKKANDISSEEYLLPGQVLKIPYNIEI